MWYQIAVGWIMVRWFGLHARTGEQHANERRPAEAEANEPMLRWSFHKAMDLGIQAFICSVYVEDIYYEPAYKS